MENVAYQMPGVRNTGSLYRPRDPTKSPVFTIVQKNWKKFELEASLGDKAPAPYVVREFKEFLSCGILGRGFVRLKCDLCNENKLLPFSCKRRGFCPSCCGRRMNEGAAFLVDNVFPHVPVRQWVLSFPIPVRFWMARNPRLVTQTLEIFHRALKTHYKQAVKSLIQNQELLTGSVTVVQRFGSALNLNIHFHALVLDGCYVIEPDANGNEQLRFIEAPRPTQAEFLALLQKIQSRMLRAFQRRGLVQKLESENGGSDLTADETIEALAQGASVQYRTATSKPAGQPVRRVGSLGHVDEKPTSTGELSAVIGGYSIHAHTYVHKNNRAELERLCRYILRPPLAEDRIEIRGQNIVYKLKSKWRDGTSAILLSGTEFIEKLVAIIPQPKIHMIRFHGILAPHAQFRSLVTPIATGIAQAEQITDDHKQKAGKPRLRWAELLRRVFHVDMEQCHCGGKLKFIAAIMGYDAIKKILDHMQLPTAVPDFAPP